MSRWIAVLGALLITGWVTAAVAQQAPPPAAQPGTSSPGGVGVMEEKTMEGKIKAIDPAGKKVTLDNGTQFSVPAAVRLEWNKLQPGTAVAILYTEAQGGEKMVKRVEVRG